MSAAERSQRVEPFELRSVSPLLDPVTAHGLLNAMTVIQTNSATLATWGHLINEHAVRDLAERIHHQALLVSEALRGAIHGVPDGVRAVPDAHE